MSSFLTFARTSGLKRPQFNKEDIRIMAVQLEIIFTLLGKIIISSLVLTIVLSGSTPRQLFIKQMMMMLRGNSMNMILGFLVLCMTGTS